ncbi:unnamed protein product [Allacma fusca]|uniref:Peptidase M14 domain-containing protein n=1 Tax=Allacma fusca TaxID=39272 RepID=A0A8J2JVJ7_9HEXA|nr:unnamed protein product [Allacma fusca]
MVTKSSLPYWTTVTAMILLKFIATVHSEIKTYEGYELYRLQLTTKAQVEALWKLQSDGEVDLWKEGGTKSKTDVFVAPDKKEKFVAFLTQNSLSGNAVENVDLKPWRDELSTRRNNKTPRGMSWNDYYNLDEIYKWLDTLPKKFPDLAKVESMGKSYEGREIKFITITLGSSSKPGILINSLFHSREWITGAVVTYFINELTTKHTEYEKLLRNYRFYIVPVVNPDGYVFSWTDDRMWRKNRNPNEGDECKGVDLERNFDIDWGGAGAGVSKCSDSYLGPSPCSEKECQALVKFMLDHKDITDYYSFHSYGQIWMTPWSYTRKKAFNDEETFAVMKKAVKTLNSIHGTDYKFGSSTDVYSPIAGTVEDWAMETAKVNYSYCIELRDKGTHGFALPPEYILPSAEEMWPAIVSSVQKLTSSSREEDSFNSKNSRTNGREVRLLCLGSASTLILMSTVLAKF